MSKNIKPIYSSKIHFTKKLGTVGEVLKSKRMALQKDLSSVSLETRIDLKKLKAMEENDYSVFESSVNAKGFIKIYSEYLGLNYNKILAIYRRDYKDEEIKKTPSTTKKETGKFSLEYLYILIPVVIILAVLIYLYNQFYNFQNPPFLEITEPENNITFYEEDLTIKGKTEKSTSIEIENVTISVDENFNFEKEITLKPGKNIITVKATNNRNRARENVEILYLLYEPPEDVIEEETVEESQGIKLNLSISNRPTWIEIIVDDQLIVSQILPVEYNTEFLATRNVLVRTGIYANTQVQINDETKMLSMESLSLSCEIVENNLECDN